MDFARFWEQGTDRLLPRSFLNRKTVRYAFLCFVRQNQVRMQLIARFMPHVYTYIKMADTCTGTQKYFNQSAKEFTWSCQTTCRVTSLFLNFVKIN